MYVCMYVSVFCRYTPAGAWWFGRKGTVFVGAMCTQDSELDTAPNDEANVQVRSTAYTFIECYTEPSTRAGLVFYGDAKC